MSLGLRDLNTRGKEGASEGGRMAVHRPVGTLCPSRPAARCNASRSASWRVGWRPVRKALSFLLCPSPHETVPSTDHRPPGCSWNFKVTGQPATRTDSPGPCPASGRSPLTAAAPAEPAGVEEADPATRLAKAAPPDSRPSSGPRPEEGRRIPVAGLSPVVSRSRDRCSEAATQQAAEWAGSAGSPEEEKGCRRRRRRSIPPAP